MALSETVNIDIFSRFSDKGIIKAKNSFAAFNKLAKSLGRSGTDLAKQMNKANMIMIPAGTNMWRLGEATSKTTGYALQAGHAASRLAKSYSALGDKTRFGTDELKAMAKEYTSTTKAANNLNKTNQNKTTGITGTAKRVFWGPKEQMGGTQPGYEGSMLWFKNITKEAKKNEKAMKDANETYFTADEFTKRLGKSHEELTTEFRNAGLELQQSEKGYAVFDTATQKIIKTDAAFKRLDKQMKRFKMERLSLMFFGMQLQRTFGGLVKGVLDTLGVMDVFNETVLVVMMPIMEPLADILFDIMSWFMDLPEPVQKVIGAIILLAAAFGTWLMWKEQIGLMTDSLKLMFGNKWVMEFAKKGWDIVTAAYAYLKDTFKAVWNFTLTWARKGWDLVTGAFEYVDKQINKLPKSVGVLIKIGIAFVLFEAARNLANKIVNSDIWGKATQTVAQQLLDWGMTPQMADSAMESDWMNRWGKAADWYTKSGEYEGSRQFGGYVPNTGMYMLHKGETVVSPAGGMSMSGTTINVNANIGSSYDVRKLGQELMAAMRLEMERTSNTRRI